MNRYSTPIKVLLVDDHQIFRDGIESMFTPPGEIMIIGLAGNGREALKMIDEDRPDVILLDLSMAEMGGLEFLKEVRHRKPFPAILILSMHSDIEFITEAIASGARGYVSKGDTDKEELREAIRAVHNGEEYYGKSIRHMMQQQFIAGYKPAEPDESKKGFEKLTRREKEILKMVMEGFSNQEIANSTFVSIRTVETHKNNIMTKLNLKNTVELVKYAIKNQFFDL